MKIYKYYDGQVYELEVRETPKTYINEGQRQAAFGYMSRFEKCDGWAVTPLEAVREKINTCLTSRGIHQDRLAKIYSDLDKLYVLEKSYNKVICVGKVL